MLFYIVYGRDRDRVALGDAGDQECPACRAVHPCKLVFEYSWGHLYFLFGRVTRWRFLMVCTHCDTEWKVDPSELNDDSLVDRAQVPFMRRWGCLVFFIGIAIAALSMVGLLYVAIEIDRHSQVSRSQAQMASLASFDPGPSPSPASEMRRLEGSWHCVSAAGKDLNVNWTGAIFTFERDTLTIKLAHNKEEKFRIQLNPETTPFQIDLIGESGVIPGVYETTGKTLYICWNQAKEARVRPADVKTAGNPDLVLFTLFPVN
jgi:uncharacterized protein (TIGR03067 family)